eukprot:TRINITY_DN1302_c2_g2_i2.p3 TRINITY_DN1302_c2_g2~~TRINITY_DN1302_c2_g2_i2.p3  ORF type:complete len:249 (-),score=19.78 TRINITY_DN1302_c2_g2_i2:509-1255(-)
MNRQYEDKRNVTPGQLFAHASTETQAMLNQVYNNANNGESPPSTPFWDQPPPFNTLQDINYLEVFPRNKSLEPKLLEDLQNELRIQLRQAEQMISTQGHNIKQHYAPSNLQFQAHQNVFAKFIKAFPSYESLLTEIKTVMDESIEDGIRSSFENVHLRRKLEEIQKEENDALTRARAQISAEAAVERQRLYDEIVEMTNRLMKAQQKIGPTAKKLEQVPAQLCSLRQFTNQYPTQYSSINIRCCRDVI